MMNATKTNKIHQGRNVKRFREMLGIKQDILAYEMGSDWNQQKISLLEQKETIENDILQKVAIILNIPVAAIENFDDDSTLNIISSTFNSNDTSTMNAINHQCTFNPIDKLIESYDENKKLYERLLESEKEKNNLLEKLLDRK
ncbi:XRE family transcriptional regulator [Flavobacterium cerinum]|uniref:XRE family transcriptional regulator n=1 Tax=Flavobacterium cerinum TaxID=2502784 RepID=A0ABY5IRM1_9FLAO|nr:XRE family transcriptional regulator [Flavobacterium cerinum]UUC45445.1 XRE family transcriptional regulator [Flavobacterium cerinum]